MYAIIGKLSDQSKPVDVNYLADFDWYRSIDNQSIDGLQSIPRESNDKDVVAILDELTIEAQSFVIVLQHGGNDVT